MRQNAAPFTILNREELDLYSLRETATIRRILKKSNFIDNCLSVLTRLIFLSLADGIV